MAGLVSGEEFTDLFRQFDFTAYRLEVRTAYGVAEEDEPYQRFLAGEEPPMGWFEPWLAIMREQTGRGKRVERVRVVDDPPSDYLQFEMWLNLENQKAGEDIRYLPRSTALQLGLPNHDSWLFDSKLLAHLQFAEEGDRFLGVTLSSDAGDLVQHNHWRDAAWHHAEPFDSYYPRITASG